MKLNSINKAYIVITFLLILSTAYKIYNYKNWERFYYFSSVCAPSSYPVYIRNIYFITANGEDAWFNDDDVNDFRTEWGVDYYSPRVSEPLRLPDKLLVEYVSYKDKEFYRDTLMLPQKEIEVIFNKALKNKTALKISGDTGDIERKGLTFLVGIANNGNIIVWLRGINFEKVILRTKLKPHEPHGDETFIEKRLSKAAYLKKAFEDLPDSVKTKLDNDFDASANYIDSPSHYIDKNKGTQD